MVSTSRIGYIALVIGFLLLLVTAAWVQFLGGDFGDKQWEILYTRMWLGGDRLYTDIFPVSPPLIFWLYSIPVALSDHFGFLHDFQALAILGIVVVGLSVFLSTCLIGLHPGLEDSRRKQLEWTALLLFVLLIRTSPMYFLDREHLFLVLIFPLITRFLPGIVDKPVSWRLMLPVGLLAGIGFCLKPHCLIVLLGILLADIMLHRSAKAWVKPEILIICAVGMIYLLLVALITPDYFRIVMPMAMATYSATRDPAPFWFYGGNALSILLPLALLFRPRYQSPFRRDIYYLAAILPFFYFYSLINNNWAYTYYPLSSMALVLSGFMLWEFLYLAQSYDARTWPSWRLWLGGTIGIGFFVTPALNAWWPVAFILLLWEYFYLWRTDRARSLPHWTFWAGTFVCVVSFALKVLLSMVYFSSVFKDTDERNPIWYRDDLFVHEVSTPNGPLSFGAISIEFSRWTRLSIYSDAQWVTRFPHLWMLPKFLSSDDAFRKAHEDILRYVAEGYAEDMNTRKPPVMFVDDTNIVYGQYVPVDLIALFSAWPDFREAWSHYRLLHRIDLCSSPANPHPRYKSGCSYDVYRRAD